MAKAAQALSSAKVLLDIGDADGACNRAYYAMQAQFKLENADDHENGGSP